MVDTADVAAPLLLFDGVCNLCNGAVRFVLTRDEEAVFRFAPLQSRAGRELLDEHGIDPGRRDTLVLVNADGVHTRSTAWVRVLRRLGGWWGRLGWLLGLIPRPVRDLGYGAVARIRYRVFGKRETCMVPESAVRDRFLDGADEIVDG